MQIVIESSTYAAMQNRIKELEARIQSLEKRSFYIEYEDRFVDWMPGFKIRVTEPRIRERSN